MNWLNAEMQSALTPLLCRVRTLADSAAVLCVIFLRESSGINVSSRRVSSVLARCLFVKFLLFVVLLYRTTDRRRAACEKTLSFALSSAIAAMEWAIQWR